MSLMQKILGNTFWQFFGRIGTALIAFLTVKLLTSYWSGGNIELGQAKYGDYVTIYEFLAIFGSLADLGIFTIAVREMSKRPEEQQEIFSATLSFRIVTLIAAMLLATAAAFLIPQYMGTEIPKGIAIAALGTGLFILSGTLSTILLVHLKMKFHAIALVAGKILTFGAIAAVIFWTSPEPSPESFYSLIWAGVWGSLLTLVMTFFFARRFLAMRPKWNGLLAKELALMALPFGLATFLNTIYFRLDVTMMSMLLPHSLESGACLAKFCGDQQVGIYGVAIRIIDVLIILPLYFMNSVLPSLASSVAERQENQAKQRLSLSLLFLLIIALPAVAGLFLLATPITELMTPPDFGSDQALRILTIPLFLTFFTTFFNFILIAYGQQKKILWINLGAVFLNLLLNLWAIPRYGFLGAAVTSAISEIFILIFGFYFVFQITRFPLLWKKISGAIFSVLGMGLFTFFAWRYLGAPLGKTTLFVIIPLAGLLYGLLLLATKTIDLKTLRLFRKGKPQG